MNNEQKQARFDQLVEEGVTASEALMQVEVEASEEENAAEVVSNLYSQLQDNGYSTEEAHQMINFKLANLPQINALMKAVRVGRMLPLSAIDNWDNMNEKMRENCLWGLGFDTKRFKYVVDVGCYRFGNSQVQCGKFVYGSERLDKEYTNKVVDGYHIASDEARFFFDREMLEVLRGNKKT